MLRVDGCEPPCGCWDLNSGPLEEQPVLLPTEPSRATELFRLIEPVIFFFNHFNVVFVFLSVCGYAHMSVGPEHGRVVGSPGAGGQL